MSVSEPISTGSGTVTGIDIAGFLVKDPAKAIAFYRDVLGMKPTAIDEEGRGAEFELADGSTFGVWKPEGDHGGTFAMLAVKDIRRAIAEYRSKGLEISEPDETPVCFMAFARDPEGNGLIVHQRK